MDHNNRILARIFLVVYLGLIAFACFGHFDKLPEMNPYFLGIPKDKVVHFIMFFPLPFLMWLAFDKYTTKTWHSLLFIIGAFLTGCVIAAATEVYVADAQALLENDPAFGPIISDNVYQAFPCGKVLAYNKTTNGIYVKTGDGILSITKLQRQGKNMMSYKDFMNGAKDFLGTVLK